MGQISPAYMITLHEGGAYVGGIMVTDDHGIPLDFKYTVPVTPTKVQRIIYGSVLEQYIRNHVVIGALAREVERQPSFFVVSQHQLFEIEDANRDMNLVSLQRSQFNALEKGSVNRVKENECLLQGWHDPHPLRVIFGSMPSEHQEKVIKELIELSRHMDLVEPLDRLEQALKTLCLEKNQD